MCSVLNIYNYPFKWITYLVVTMGIYTFLYWLLAIPLLYFHFYDCCNDKWSKNWIIWFLTISFASWLGVSILILFMWFCLRWCKVRHLNESNIRLTGNSGKNLENTENSKDYEKSNTKNFKKSLESIKENAKEIVGLPELQSKDNFTVLQMNDQQPTENSVSPSEFPIPVDKSEHYIQNEPPQPSENEEKQLKTPREIFFKDLIEAASKAPSYFDFDPEKFSEDIKKKYELEKPTEGGEGQTEEGNNYFLGSSEDKKNLTSEVLINLNEKGFIVDEPVVYGRFQILKE